MIRSLFGRTKPNNDNNFRWRSAEPSRIEDLSDAVIGFAITLLIVSLEVPRTFDELLITIRGFGAFAISFALLVVIWYEHYKFFRRYGLQDSRVIVLNALLLFVILFYVYPLKFLFTISVNGWLGIEMMEASQASTSIPTIRQEQVPLLFSLYGLGWTAVYAILGLFYRHALTQRQPLELNELEVFDTRASMIENFLAAGIGVLAMLLAFILPLELLSLAGWIYLLLFPLNWGLKRWRDRRRMAIKSRLAAP